MTRVYIVEGLDGVGKTTVARGLAARLNWVYMSTPPDEFRKTIPLYDCDLQDEKRFRFYMEGNYLTTAQIHLQREDIPIVLDRYVFTTLAYHNALLQTDLSADVDWRRIISPTVGFYLIADKSVRDARMQKRGVNSAFDDTIKKDLTLAARIEEQYDRLLTDYVKIDTSDLSPCQVIEEMMRHILQSSESYPADAPSPK